jgi:hypothetical protein
MSSASSKPTRRHALLFVTDSQVISSKSILLNWKMGQIIFQ